MKRRLKEFFEKQPIFEPTADILILVGVVLIFAGIHIFGGIVAGTGAAIYIFLSYRE